jgi:hypothetical protein
MESLYPASQFRAQASSMSKLKRIAVTIAIPTVLCLWLWVP